jgi:hypothetical protein
VISPTGRQCSRRKMVTSDAQMVTEAPSRRRSTEVSADVGCCPSWIQGQIGRQILHHIGCAGANYADSQQVKEPSAGTAQLASTLRRLYPKTSSTVTSKALTTSTTAQGTLTWRCIGWLRSRRATTGTRAAVEAGMAGVMPVAKAGPGANR